MADYNIRGIYEGAESSFESQNDNRLVEGYRIPTGQVGVNVNPMTANQIGELNKSLNQGMIPIEVGTVQPDVFDTIPKEHFKEIRRMAQLTGSKVALHAPIVGIEPSGLDPQGRTPWTDQSRQAIEEQLKLAVEKAIELDANGGVPITMHASNIPLGGWEKRDGEIVKTTEWVVNRETGQMSPVEESTMYRPSGTTEKFSSNPKDQFKSTMSPFEAIENQNYVSWDNSINEVLMKKDRADEILREVAPAAEKIIELSIRENGKFDPSLLNPEQILVYERYANAQTFLQDVEQSASTLFGRAYKYNVIQESDEKKREKMKQKMEQLAEMYKEQLGIPPKGRGKGRGGMEGWTDEEKRKYFEKQNSLRNQSQAIQNLTYGLKEFAPEILTSATKFATDKSSETFANVAMYSYKLAEKKAKDENRKIDPSIISIENLYPDLGFARGEDMKALIETSREKFANQLMKGEKLSKQKAQEMAEKVIGMTFDVGHLNMFKKQGFTDEDLIKEAEQIKKFVKHVHITDNFGYNDAHLPPGMGNVPVKELMKEIEAKNFKGKYIVEAGGFIQHFGRAAYIDDLEGLGSPMFREGVNNSYWSQSSLGSAGYSGSFQQGYFGGFGGMLPQMNYETFGAGFSNLPVELGGSRQGGGGRMSQTPME